MGEGSRSGGGWLRKLILTGILLLVIAAALGVAAYRWMDQLNAVTELQGLPKLDPKTASHPLDPWKIEPVPVEATLMILPFAKDGMRDGDGENLATLIQEQWASGLPRNIAIVPGSFTRYCLQTMHPYTASEDYPEVAEANELMRNFYGATHWTRGDYREENGQLIVNVDYRVRGRQLMKEFRFPEGNDYEAGAAIARWIAEEADLELDEKQIARISQPHYGDKVKSSDDPLIGEMDKDPNHPEWLRIGEVDQQSTVRTLYRMIAATNTKSLVMSERLDPGPLPPDAPVPSHFIRCYAFDYWEMPGNFRHERTLLMAAYPGLYSVPYRYVYYNFGKGEKRDEYLEGVRQWHKRAPKSPFRDFMLAEALYYAAWDYRGSGYANTVSQDGFAHYRKYRAEALELFQSALDAAGLVPYLYEEYLSTLGEDGSLEEMMRIQNNLMAAWPDYVGTWSTILHYNRPRWGGNEATARALIDHVMKERPDNMGVGRLAILYHKGEAEQNQTLSRDRSFLAEYCKDDPEVKRQVYEGLNRLISTQASESDAAYGFYEAVLMKDRDVYRLAVRNHTMLHRSFADRNRWQFNAVYYRILNSYTTNGQWESLKDGCEFGKRIDDQFKKDKPAYCAGCDLIFPTDNLYQLYYGLSLVMTGSVDEGLALIELAGDREKGFPMTALGLFTAGRLSEDDLARLESQLTRNEKPSEDSGYLLAMYWGSRDDQAKAREYWEKSEALHPEWPWLYLRSEAAKAAGVTLEEDVTTKSAGDP